MADNTANPERQTPLDLDALERLANAATPGPWDTDQEGDVVSWHQGTASDSPPPVPIASPLEDDEEASNPGDMDFIAAFHPETAKALIAECRRLRAERDARPTVDDVRREAFILEAVEKRGFNRENAAKMFDRREDYIAKNPGEVKSAALQRSTREQVAADRYEAGYIIRAFYALASREPGTTEDESRG